MKNQIFIIYPMNELQVCVAEGVDIHPLVLEKFIKSCGGDIRKTIMHLQFWFQSRRLRKGASPSICLLSVHMLYDWLFIIFYENHSR